MIGLTLYCSVGMLASGIAFSDSDFNSIHSNIRTLLYPFIYILISDSLIAIFLYYEPY